jgi:gamma-glutamyl-gamma-aminobutyrate hydrolase PuuD
MVNTQPEYILVLGDESYGVPFKLMGYDVWYWDTSQSAPNDALLTDAELVLFTGGEDISPELYGEVNLTSYTDAQRDLIEVGIYLKCIRWGVPMAGICRGSQFLRGVHGGKLYQHIEHHGIGGVHSASFAPCVYDLAIENSPEPIMITSTHHQAAVPDVGEDNFIDLLFGENDGVRTIEGWMAVDGDIAAVQYHPEYMPEDSDGMHFFQALMRNLLCELPMYFEIQT